MANGQSYLTAASLALDKPPAHEAVYRLFDLLGGHFAALRAAPGREMVAECDPAWAAALERLAMLSSADAEPILTRTTAVGPQLRRKLDPVLVPLLQHFFYVFCKVNHERWGVYLGLEAPLVRECWALVAIPPAGDSAFQKISSNQWQAKMRLAGVRPPKSPAWQSHTPKVSSVDTAW